MLVDIALGSQERGGGLEGPAPVEVVGVDDGEGAVHLVKRAERGVGGAPGLHPALRDGKALRQLIQGLVGVGQVHAGGLDAIADGRAKVRFHLGLDDADHLAEARAHGVEYGKIDNDVSGVVHGRDLLATAETAAHARRHDDECRSVHVISPDL